MKIKTFEEKMQKCNEFFDSLSKILEKKYVVIGSCNKDASAYLVKKGTENQISYYGKPGDSFRVSDHWNWYSNIKRCANRNEVQCYNVDIPNPRSRDTTKPDAATMPRRACQVAYYNSSDRRYHIIYGERWNRETKQWEWVENDPTAVARKYA